MGVLWVGLHLTLACSSVTTRRRSRTKVSASNRVMLDLSRRSDPEQKTPFSNHQVQSIQVLMSDVNKDNISAFSLLLAKSANNKRTAEKFDAYRNGVSASQQLRAILETEKRQTGCAPSPGTRLRRIMHRVVLSRSRKPMASSSSRSICRPMAFRASGLFKLSTEIPSEGPPRGSTSTCSCC